MFVISPIFFTNVQQLNILLFGAKMCPFKNWSDLFYIIFKVCLMPIYKMFMPRPVNVAYTWTVSKHVTNICSSHTYNTHTRAQTHISYQHVHECIHLHVRIMFPFVVCMFHFRIMPWKSHVSSSNFTVKLYGAPNMIL